MAPPIPVVVRVSRREILQIFITRKPVGTGGGRMAKASRKSVEDVQSRLLEAEDEHSFTDKLVSA